MFIAGEHKYFLNLNSNILPSSIGTMTRIYAENKKWGIFTCITHFYNLFQTHMPGRKNAELFRRFIFSPMNMWIFVYFEKVSMYFNALSPCFIVGYCASNLLD